MKKFSKILSVALLVALVLSLGVANAFAAGTASITITRDGSYGEGSGEGNEYSYYKVFSASYDSNTSTGGGSTDGDPGVVSGSAEAVAYTATPAVAAKLGTIDAETKAWTTNSGNEWFDLTYIPSAGNYSVSWRTGVDKDADTVQEAAAWLIANGAYESGPTALTATDTGWTSGDIDAGYYLVKGATGDNLVAATSDISIKEKNTYPTLDKTQADEDFTAQNHDTRDVAIGDELTYEVKVTIPATAKVGDQILVWDKASQGLTYVANSVAVKEGSNTGNATIGDPATADVDSTWSWSKLITVTDGSQGTDVVFTFVMKVNDEALVDSEKENESGLKYGHNGDWNYESKPVKVEYKTYFAGIHKIDGTTKANLAGVEFTLKEGTAEFTVSKPDGKEYYVYDPAGSSTVVTDENGLIRIRGLDEDKTYTLTETKNPHSGYNMLAEPVTLTLYVDTYTVIETSATGEVTKSESSYYDGTATDTWKWQEVENNKGTLLPSTGGIGTTIFYVVGGVLVLAAIILLVTKKRMSE